MGGNSPSLPLISRRNFEIALQYNVREKHINQMYQQYLKYDVNKNGVWTVNEVFELINEPQLSMVAPYVEKLFMMADTSGAGQMSFEDFLVSFTSFCSLGKEEILQFMFMVIDNDCSGFITRGQLIDFFTATKRNRDTYVPLFPKNMEAAIQTFCDKNGEQLIFDQMAQLCEVYPLVGFAAFHTQFLIQNAVLGKAFWEKWEADRLRVFYMEAESLSITEEVIIQQECIKISKPGRFVFKEILEFVKRKSYMDKGKKVCRQEERIVTEGNNSDERDESISRTPILNIMRNPAIPYHVPYVPVKYRTSEQVQQIETIFEADDESKASMASRSESGFDEEEFLEKERLKNLFNKKEERIDDEMVEYKTFNFEFDSDDSNYNKESTPSDDDPESRRTSKKSRASRRSSKKK